MKLPVYLMVFGNNDAKSTAAFAPPKSPIAFTTIMKPSSSFCNRRHDHGASGPLSAASDSNNDSSKIADIEEFTAFTSSRSRPTIHHQPILGLSRSITRQERSEEYLRISRKVYLPRVIFCTLTNGNIHKGVEFCEE